MLLVLFRSLWGQLSLCHPDLIDTCRKTSKVRSKSFFTAPNVLVLYMPVTDRQGDMRAEHIGVFDQLNLARWMQPEAPELKSQACLDYDLVSVVVHHGETFETGHYHSYCRRQAAGKARPKFSHNQYRCKVFCRV